MARVWPDTAADEQRLAGMASVAALTFLVARAVPGGYWVAVAGGVPLARAGQRHGARAGWATAAAGLLETVAVMGPVRLSIPLPHALSAPALGILHRRDHGFLVLTAASAGIRYLYYSITFAFYVVVLVGLAAFTGTYEQLRQLLPLLPAGTLAAVWVSAVGFLLWSLGAGVIQAWVLRRGLRRWPVDPVVSTSPQRAGHTRSPPSAWDPRLVAAAAGATMAAALATTNPPVLAGVAAWLTLLWLFARPGWRALAGGLALAAPLTLSTLLFGLVGGIGTAAALSRAARVALLVLTAVWLRAVVGADGLREVALRVVRRLCRFRTVALTASVLGASAGAADYGRAGRRLGQRLRATRKRPAPILDTVLEWLGHESDSLSTQLNERNA